MRSLIIPFLLIFNSSVFSYYQTAGVNYLQNNNTSFSNSTEIAEGSTSTTNFTYGLLDWKRHHSFSLGLQQRNLPYEKMKILNENSELVPLSETYGNGTEHWLSFAHDYSKNRLNLSTSISSPITRVPYSRQSAAVSMRYSINERFTALASTEYQLIKKPVSYGSTATEDIKLPERVHLTRFIVGSEHILGPRLKLGISGETAKYQNERPRHFGYSAKLATALATDPMNIFLKGGHTYRKEVSSDLLYTIGGHLQYQSTFIELTIEPIYDLLVSTSYQLTSEKQDEQEANRLTQLAYDQYAMAVSYDWDHMKTTIKASYLMPNQLKNKVNMEGGIEWTF